MKKITQAALKKYVSAIGKESFISGYYYTESGLKYELAVKALACGIMNLQDKLTLQRAIKSLYINDRKLREQANEAVNKFYVRLCK